MKIGNTFINDKGLILLILGQDDEHDYIYFCGLCVQTDEKSYQMPFLPIHKDMIQKFVDESSYIGQGKISPIIDSIEQWINFNNGGKTFFTIPVMDIWYTGVKMMQNISNHERFIKDDGLGKEIFVFPNMFPSTQEIIDQQVKLESIV